MKHNKKNPAHPLHSKEKNPAKKKVCQFCGHNQYSDKYSGHLRKQHPDLMNKRKQIKRMVKILNAEQLEQARQFIDKCLKKWTTPT